MAERVRRTTATVVFTDMVGSSALRSRLGEERADELRGIHDALLAARVRAGGGRVLRGRGDGLVAAFGGASAALGAAVEMQQAVSAYNRRHDALAQISIRVGVSTGDVSWEDGDCFGTPLVEAARLEAAAAGGQILCSDYVRMMARGRGGHEFREIGLLELRGLPEPLAVSEVVWSPGPEPGGIPLPAELAVPAARPFVSRTAELALAARILGDRGRSRATVLWVLGEPGIGKTRLATEIARLAHEGGALVLFGRCGEDLTVPYQPFLEALRWFLEHVPEARLRARLGALAGELTRLVPELGERLGGLEPRRAASPEIEQHRLFEALRGWMAAAGEDRPVVAVLDDLHWADRSTLALLGHIVRSAEGSRALLVCTARTTSPDDSPALAGLAEELERRSVPSHRLELGGLDVDEVGELVCRAAGRALDDRLRVVARRLQADTAGNPLYVDALLASRSAGGGRAEGEVPRTLSESVSRRVGRLPGEVGELLRVAAVEGLDFDLRVTARAARREEPATLEALEGAVRAGLVEEPAPNRYRFAHGLVRAALREGLSRSRRARVHLAVADAIESVFGDQLDEHVPALAHHYLEAVPAGGAARAYRYAVLAGERATRLLSHHEAVEAYAHALDLLDQVDDRCAVTRCGLLLSLGDARTRCNDPAAAAAYLSAAELARSDGDRHSLARAALGLADVWTWTGTVDRLRIDLLEEALAALTADSPLRARVLGRLATELYFAPDSLERRDRLTAESVRVARRLEDPLDLASCLHARNYAVWGPGAAVEQLRLGREIVGLAAEAANPELVLQGHAWCQTALLELGDVAGLDAELAAYERVAEALRQPRFTWYALTRRAMRTLLAGDLDEGARLAREHLEVGRRSGQVDAENVFFSQMSLVWQERPAPDVLDLVRMEFVKLESRLPAGSPHVMAWHSGVLRHAMTVDLQGEARTQLDWFRELGFDRIPKTFLWSFIVSALAEAVARLGRPEEIACLYRLLLPYDRYTVQNSGAVGCQGAFSHYLGVLAGALRHREAADRHFAAATAMHERMGARALLTRTRLEWAEMLMAGNRRGDTDSALGLLDLVDDHAARLGLTVLAERARALRVRAGPRAGEV